VFGNLSIEHFSGIVGTRTLSNNPSGLWAGVFAVLSELVGENLAAPFPSFLDEEKRGHPPEGTDSPSGNRTGTGHCKKILENVDSFSIVYLGDYRRNIF